MITKSETAGINCLDDIVKVRQTARAWAVSLGFNLVEQTRIVTAASELARNTLVHGMGGSVRFEAIQDGSRTGLRLIFHDDGPGIADIEQALADGFTTGDGLGLGLGGSRRLMNELDITSAPGKGTTVSATRWR